MLSSIMSFQSQFIDEEVLKKEQFLLNPQQTLTTNMLLGRQDSIFQTPQNVHISFTSDYYQYS